MTAGRTGNEAADQVSTDSPPAPEVSAEELTVVPVRHPLRWVAVVILAVLAAMLIHSLVVNPAWQWSYFQGYFTDSQIIDGIWVTLELTFLAMLVGIVLGIILAIMRMSPNPVLSTTAWLYTWFFRGTPVLVQILFWFSFAYLFSNLSIGIPFGPTFHTWDTNSLITPFIAAVLGLGLNEAAYMSEIARAGLLSVNAGQSEAAAALGMSRGLALRRIILPQAMRVIIPPTGNETISMLKTTSLVIVISLNDLLGGAQNIYNQATFLQVPLLVVASAWYLLMTSILSIGQYFLERHFGRGVNRNTPARPMQRLMTRMRSARNHEPEVAGG
jgi:polar amino acid transport system permease protein